MPDRILFYRTSDAYGIFSNFAPASFVLDGRSWRSSEHYFQAQKFAGTPHEEAIRAIPSPMMAARRARSRSLPLRPDWEAAKDDIMRRAVDAKFSQHADLGRELLGTGAAEIVEHTSNDSYWADGGDGTGRNMLGRILMETRDDLRRREPMISRWRRHLPPDRAWVLFDPDTVVVPGPASSPVETALAVLDRCGPVHAGSPSGDFSVDRHEDGWLIAYDCPDVLTWVEGGDSEVVAGLTGRAMRDEAASRQRVLHVQAAAD